MLSLPKRLGLPGVIDVHTHFMPPNVLAKVQAVFDAAETHYGRPWPIAYRGDEDVMVATLRELGVRRFSALSYAHRPGMAEWLNDWAAGFADRTPEAYRCATFYPEPSAASYVRARLEAGVELWKIHVQVSNLDVTDPLLDDAWGLIAEAGTPVVLHAGSGPLPAEFTGPGPVAALLRRHPSLPLVMAHAGAPEYAEFLALAETHDRLGLDTTMVFTDFFDEMAAQFPPALLPRLRELGLEGRVFLGSDFPNIPYAYEHQLDSLERLELGEDWLRAVVWDNAAVLLR